MIQDILLVYLGGVIYNFGRARGLTDALRVFEPEKHGNDHPLHAVVGSFMYALLWPINSIIAERLGRKVQNERS